MNLLLQNIREQFRSNEAVCGQVISLFQLISNKTRFRIVCLLVEGEFSVQEIADTVETCKLSNISQQLKTLALAGVVEKRREQQRVLYRIADERVRNLIVFLRKQFIENGTNL